MQNVTIQAISLADFLSQQWGVEANVDLPSGVAIVQQAFQTEGMLRKLLPGGLVRRLDAGFARSSTVHPDTAQALYSICRVMQPKCVFETGTYWGYSTAYLAAAIRDNGTGKIHTFDIYPRAGKHIPRKLRQDVQFHLGKPSTETMPDVLKDSAPDLFFQDSRHDYEGVSDELRIVKPYLKQNSVVLFHDFVDPQVRRAAIEVLQGYAFCTLISGDVQQLGIAFRDLTA